MDYVRWRLRSPRKIPICADSLAKLPAKKRLTSSNAKGENNDSNGDPRIVQKSIAPDDANHSHLFVERLRFHSRVNLFHRTRRGRSDLQSGHRARSSEKRASAMERPHRNIAARTPCGH